MSCDVLNRLPDSWQDLREIVVYGFGKVVQRNIDKIVRDFSVKCGPFNPRKSILSSIEVSKGAESLSRMSMEVDVNECFDNRKRI